nr:three component ABC system middle component [uncultured Albidiferax sp.]
MTTEIVDSAEPNSESIEGSSKFNNFAIGAAGLMAVLEETNELSVAKSLLVMPLIMHDATVRFLGKTNIRAREVTAIVSLRPDLFLNFNSRYLSSLTSSVNAIQFLVETGYIQFEEVLQLKNKLEFSENIGARAIRIKKASKNIAALLSSSEEELYLNLRVEL